MLICLAQALVSCADKFTLLKPLNLNNSLSENHIVKIVDFETYRCDTLVISQRISGSVISFVKYNDNEHLICKSN